MTGKKEPDDGNAIGDFVPSDHGEGVAKRHGRVLDFFGCITGGFAGGEVFGEEDVA